MYSPIHDSILNHTQLSLEKARKHLNTLYNNNNIRNKSSSAYRNPIINNSQYYYSPKINTIKPTRAKTKQKLISNKIQNKFNSNFNIGYNNEFNSINQYNDNNIVYEINKKQKEFIDLSRQLEKELRFSNDKNFGILHSYEKLKAKIDQINKENTIFEEEIKQNDDFTLKIKNENIELKNNINNLLSNYENENKEIIENYNMSKKDYKNSFEKYENLININKSLEKTKSDMKDVIYKMKDTINFLEKKKSLVTYDVDIIERKIRDRNIEIEIRDNQLNNLIRNYDLLRKESMENNNILQNTMNEYANENNNRNERFEQIKQSLKSYDMKIIELLNTIRERDKDIEEIKIQYKMINDKLEKKRQLYNNYIYSINNNNNQNNNNQNKYSINTIPEESNFETIEHDEKKNMINIENKKLNIEKINKENILKDNNNIEEKIINENKNYNINNNVINNFNNKENNEDKNNLNQQVIDNNYHILEKNNSQTLLDENKKLQEEYKQLIKDNINPIIEGKISDKNKDDNKEENNGDNNEENKEETIEENKEETNEVTKEENKEESKEEELKNISNLS